MGFEKISEATCSSDDPLAYTERESNTFELIQAKQLSSLLSHETETILLSTVLILLLLGTCSQP